MSTLLQLQNAFKSFGARSIFSGASFAVNEDEHVGVIGPNGAGKTTLFKVLADEEQLDRGDLVRSKSLRLGYLAQHDEWAPGATVEDYLSQNSVTPLWELKRLALGLGLNEDIFSREIASLSGGYRMRCKLLYLIGQQPNLMLLDEPTNYLDLDSLLVLESFLQSYRGAFLLISHDREFLRRTTDHILEVEGGEMTKYNGNIDDYFEQKTMLRSQLEARALSLSEKRKEILDFVARFGAKASKARQAQSRLKSLDRLETIEVKALPVSARISIPPPLRCGKAILTLKDVHLGYGEKVVLRDINFEIQNGDHVGVVGVNGAGKSTFLKALSGALQPLRGNVELGYQVSVGYYAQHVAEALDPQKTVLEAMSERAHADLSRQDCLNMAGSLLFSGDDMLKKVSVLSGGEKSRVALGRMLLQKVPCLILDEPTNHLDFQTVEALTLALQSYVGTVIVVSHDRGFIRRIGSKILEVRDGKAMLYPGTYDDYVWSRQQGALKEQRLDEERQSAGLRSKPAVVKPLNVTDEDRRVRKELAQELQRIEKSLGSLEKKMQTRQNELEAFNERVAGGDISAVSEMTRVQTELAAFEDEWLSLEERRSEIKNLSK